MITPPVKRPDPAEFGGDFAHYIQLAPDGDLLAFLAAQLSELLTLLRDLPDRESLVLHPPYTWTVKQVVGHMTDCERVFGYRTLRLARGDQTPLPAFDENSYMRHADFNRWPLSALLDEFELLRRSHLAMLGHFEPEAWSRRGTVSAQPMSVRAMAYAIAGHAKHHLDILHRRLGR